MRNIFITLLGIIYLSPFLVMAQDFDDIYYDASKEKKSSPNVSTNVEYTNLSRYAEEPSTSSNIVDERDVDEYNRRWQDDSSNQIDTISGNDKNFTYTQRIEKYHNPSIIENQNDSVLEVLYYTAAPATVNIIVGSPDVYSPWSFGFGYGMSYYDPWNWRYSSFYDPWYSPFYNPWNWGYNHYYHHHHHHGHYPYYPTYSSNDGYGRRPYGYNARNNSSSLSRRPGYSSGNVNRPGQNGRVSKDGQFTRRPGYSENNRGSATNRNERPAYNNNNRRPSGSSSTVRPTTPIQNNRNNSNYRENNRRESYSTPSYQGGGNSGNSRGGGGSVGGGGGGNSRGGGRR